MKVLIILTAILFSNTFCHGQNGEFKIYQNGLMYSDTTMKQLEFIVDSLNLQFRICELNKTYYAKSQAKAHFVSLEKGNIKEAKKDMANNMPFEAFIKKYPQATIEKDLLVVKFAYKDYDGTDIVEFSSLLNEHTIEIEGKEDVYKQKRKGSWVFNYWNGRKYMSNNIEAFYFTKEFNQQEVPINYARMIQYSNCMVDTSTQVMKENAQATNFDKDSKNTSKVDEFISYIHQETNKPTLNKDTFEENWAKYREWDSLKLQLVVSLLAHRAEFSDLMQAAVEEALEYGGSSDELEEYVGQYYDKNVTLELKRGRNVIGFCSMDEGPRVHALNIAVLSAETINWEIFLRAHLNIMNDRFERVTDGSYAWAGRLTYIKELEELDINVLDLLLGISLRIENPSQNHYYGSISRLGRALSESAYSKEIESKMLEMIQDQQLDDYNRILIYYLYRNYHHNLENESLKKKNLLKLEQAVATLPEYLKANIDLEK